MKKLIIFIIFLILVSICILFYYYTIKNNTNSKSYETSRTSTNNTSQDEQNVNISNFSNQEETKNTTTVSEEQKNDQFAQEQKSMESEEISSFSTKIYTKDKNRQTNINITCSSLNNTEVKNGQTFSFCDTVGRSSPSKGYKKADIFTNGKKTKGYGGGNCQISTTLYNAVLKVPNLKVTERHEHSNKVPYIKDGKDAAVSYGTYDFKFINNTGNTIKINAFNDSNSITIKLVKLQ